MSLSLYSSYRQRQLEALLEISRALTARLDLPSLLRIILSYTAEMIRAEMGYIALMTPKGSLRLAAGYGLSSLTYNALAPYLDQKSGDPDFWNNRELRRQLSIVAEATSQPFDQVVALPLVIEDNETVGGIFLFRSGSVAFTASDQSLLRDFADQAAIAVRNARAVEQLREEKARLEAVIENSPNGVLILSPALRVLVINRAFSNLVGISQTEAVGRSCAELLGLQNTSGDHLCLADRPPSAAYKHLVWRGRHPATRSETYHGRRHLLPPLRP